MVVEDYSPGYFEGRTGGNIPPSYEGKFVHIVGPDEEYLVLSPVELTEFHAHIVQRFSRRRAGISSVSLPSGEDVRFGTPGWSIRGGGRFHLDRTARCLSLWGSSKAYGNFDGAHLLTALESAAGWEEHHIHMGEPL
jgi:hypothetical protein